MAPVTETALPFGFARSMTSLPSPLTEKSSPPPPGLVADSSSAREGRAVMWVTSSGVAPRSMVKLPPALGRNTLSSS